MDIFSSTPLLPALMTALGIGLMIGMVRERTHLETFAGVRTHALTALAAVLATSLGTGPLLVLLGLVLVLVSLAYWRSAAQDAGLTGEIALMVTALLGSLAVSQTALAAGLGALAAVLLYAKTPLHRFAKEVLSEREVHDGIILLASALIILPLLPDRAIDHYGVLNPAKLWRLVVLVMLVGAIAHVALRLVGNRWGLPLAGFFSGYVSSTAATLSSAGTRRAGTEVAGFGGGAVGQCRLAQFVRSGPAGHGAGLSAGHPLRVGRCHRCTRFAQRVRTAVQPRCRHGVPGRPEAHVPHSACTGTGRHHRYHPISDRLPQ
jgi:hypothetical protein